MMYNSGHQLLMQTLPVVYALTIINAKAIHRALDWHIQHLQLLLEESLLAPVRLLDKARAFGHTMLIGTRNPALQNVRGQITMSIALHAANDARQVELRCIVS